MVNVSDNEDDVMFLVRVIVSFSYPIIHQLPTMKPPSMETNFLSCWYFNVEVVNIVFISSSGTGVER